MKQIGTVTALVTPFRNGAIDKDGLVHLIEKQIAAHVTAILVLGTTGEAPTLTTDEQEHVITTTVKAVAGRVPVWVGTSSNCTRQAIENTQRARSLGADVALIAAPYYNKPTQEGLFRHFEEVATEVDIPIVVYNIPGRTGTNIEPATLMRIAALSNIIGVKEASGSVAQIADILRLAAQQYPNFAVWSGDDALTLPLMALGAVGVVSVISNLVPEQVVALVQAMLTGDLATARKLHYALDPLVKIAFIETNPAPIKAAMQLCGLPSGGCRLPLVDLTASNLSLLRQQLQQLTLVTN
jgi:4-hydroxy-tetrahydrodipicolinate synthase